MGDCEQFVKRLSNYADREMEHDELERWDMHLSSCTKCSSLLKSTQNLGEEMRKLAQVKVSPDFNAVLRARIRMEQHQRVWPRFITEPLWGSRIPAFGAAAILVFAVSFVLFSQIRPDKINSHKTIVLTPISRSQTHDVQNVRDVDETSTSRSHVNYVLEQVTLDDLLKGRRGVALSSEGLAQLEKSRYDSLKQPRYRNFPHAQYVTQRRTGVRF